MRRVFPLVAAGLFISLAACNKDFSPSPSDLQPTDSNPLPTSTPTPTPTSPVAMNSSWTPQWDHVVSYWGLSDGSGQIANGDSISDGAGLPGVAVNPSGSGMSYSPLQVGNAITLNGIDSYIDINSAPDLPTGYSPRTLCGWGNIASTSGGYSWIASFGLSGTGNAMFIGNLGDTLVGGGYNADDVYSYHFWQPGIWHHVCLTYDGTYATLYGDGALVSGPTLKNWNLIQSAAYLGKQVNGSEYWNGSIAEIAIWDTALSAQEIQEIYTRQVQAF